MTRLRGLDVSSCQGTIRWADVPPEFAFVVVKVSEGTLGLDPLRQFNLAAAALSGRQTGVYHFFRSSQDPKGQAERLWDAVGSKMPSFVALDFETLADGLSPEAGVDRALECADHIESFFGRPPLLYGFPWFDGKLLGAAFAARPRIARLPLWMADYSGGELPPETWHPHFGAPWTTWALAQTSGNNSSRVAGIVGAVDHNIANGDLEWFRTTICGLPPTASVGEPPSPIVHAPIDFPEREPPTEE